MFFVFSFDFGLSDELIDGFLLDYEFFNDLFSDGECEEDDLY